MKYDKTIIGRITHWLPIVTGCLVFASFSSWAGNSGVLSLGNEHSCGIKTDNTVVCWGRNDYGQANPPAGTFTQISAGVSHTCGIKTNGTISCWGRNNEGQSSQPVGGFIWINAGSSHTCALKPSGTAICWGDATYGKSSPPLTTFTQITAGEHHSCGLKSDGRVECWGYDSYSRTSPPNDTFTQISAGQSHTCGLTKNGTGVCWGNPSKSLGYLIQAGAYCGLKTDRTGMCHSGNLTSSAFPVSGVFTYMAGSYYHGCGLRNNGAVECWGSDRYGQTTPPTGATFKQPSPTLTPPQPIELINLSTRATIQKGAGNVIAGFIIRGNGAKRILIRAWGRGLGFATGLDAYLTLTTINGNVIDENDNWQNHRNASSIPDHYRLPDPTDAALLLYLPAGAYTAIMSSRGTTGIGLIGVNAID